MDVICLALTVYYLVVILRIILGMVTEFGRIPWGHPVRRITDLLGRVVDPLLRPIRRILSPVRMGGMNLDLSPLVLLIGLLLIQRILCR